MRIGPLLILAWSVLVLTGLVAGVLVTFARGGRGAALGLLLFVGTLLSGGLVLAWIGAVESPAFRGTPLFIAEIIMGVAGLVMFSAAAIALGRDAR